MLKIYVEKLINKKIDNLNLSLYIIIQYAAKVL